MEIKDIGNIALLIDIENISPKYAKLIFDEVSNYGKVTYKRAYADWTSNLRENWKQQCLEYAITPIQQYSYTSGKNSTDSALIIDAMDIMYAKNVSGFCIVSSDSDFIKLALRLREEGMFVIGMGEEKTSKDTVSAFDKFIYLDVLFGKGKQAEKPGGIVVLNEGKQKRKMTIHADTHEPPAPKGKPAKPAAAPVRTVGKIPSGFVEELTSIIDSWSDDDGWANLANVGNMLTKRNPDFDSRNYGFKKLNDMIKHIGVLEMKLDSDKKICFVKIKDTEEKNDKTQG